MFLISIYLQGALINLSPVETGTYLIPVFVTLAIFGPLSGWLSDKYNSRFFSALGLFISGIGFLFLTQLQIKANFIELLLPFILIGAGMGMFASPNRASIMNSVPRRRRGYPQYRYYFILCGQDVECRNLLFNNDKPSVIRIRKKYYNRF